MTPSTDEHLAPTTQKIATRSRRGLVGRADLLGGLAAALGAVLVAAWVLQIWDASARVPFALGGDANGALNAIKNLLRHDWYYTTDQLGAPFGQKLYDFPAAGDLWNLLTVKSLGVFTGDPALVMNAFFLMTFPLTALSAYIAMRVLGVQIALAAALGVLYSVLPYHFQRGEPHLFLSAYFAVPLACAVLVRQMDTRTMARLPRRGVPLRETLLSRGTVGALAVALLVAGTGLYYAFFFVVLAAVVGGLGSLRTRSLWPLLSAGLLAGVVIAVVALTNVPSLLYQADHGANEQVATNRATTDVDNYGLKIANLVLPVTNHRVDALAELKAEALGGPVPSEGTEALGLVGAAGFVGLLVTAFWRLSTGRNREADRDAPDETIGRLAALTITSLVLAVIGGGATVLSVAGFSELHAWNRISVFIAFFSFAAVGIWLTALLRRYIAVRRVGLAAIAVGLVALGAYDQTTPAFTPAYAATSAAYGNDRAFVARAERVLGRSASIFQLPYVKFPEYPPVFGMVDYDHLRGYVHSDSLRWSYGGVKGRESEWQDNLVKQPLEVMVAGVAAAGFDGLYVDREGYADRAAQLERDLRGLLGPAQFESEDARLVMYDLRPVRRRLDATLSTTQARRTRDAILHPPQVHFGPGFSAEERDPTTGTTWHWVQGRAELDIVNTTMHRQRVVISFDIASLTAGANVLVTGLAPGVVLPTPDGRTDVEREVTLAPGVNRVRFTADAADLRFQVVGFRVVAPGLSGVADVVQAAPAAA